MFPGGRPVTTLVNAAPIYSEPGEIVSVLVVFQDLSPLEELDRMRADFLNLVSDECIVRAFEMGADDFIVKPFSPSELMARIKASFRKRADTHLTREREEFPIGDLLISYPERKVSVGGRKVHLTATEYQLLYELSTRAGRVLSQDDLLRRIRGEEYVGDIQLLRAFVKTLRQKLGDNARSPSYIFTEHGVGYRMPKP